MRDTLTTKPDQRRRQFANIESHLLSRKQFNHEIVRERFRATRRSISFCVLTLRVLGRIDRKKSIRVLEKILLRNLRFTDHKAKLGRTEFGVLLVDTPEMGGRCVLDRLRNECDCRNIRVEITLRVHDPNGFSDDDKRDDNSDQDSGEKRWHRIDDSQVEIADEHTLSCQSATQMGMKRAVDVLGATAGLILTGPLIAAGAVAIKLTSPGPAFFAQTREGRSGKPFKIYKLRTMVVDAEKRQEELRSSSHRDGPAFKIKKDPRVTPVGRVLRAICLDELPQLWNILKGEMSLVGPRPLPWHESRACSRWHRRRLDIRPGLTCHWQVNKAAAESFDDWMRMDLRYISEMGLMTDLCLIAKTVTVPILARGSE